MCGNGNGKVAHVKDVDVSVRARHNTRITHDVHRIHALVDTDCALIAFSRCQYHISSLAASDHTLTRCHGTVHVCRPVLESAVPRAGDDKGTRVDPVDALDALLMLRENI